MEIETINKTICDWQEMTHTILDPKKFSLTILQQVFKETYIILTEYHRAALIPKDVSKLLLEMDDFLHFITIIDNKELCIDFYYYQYIAAINTALKKGFFNSNYKYSFPQLNIVDAKNNEIIIDFDTNVFTSL